MKRTGADKLIAAAVHAGKLYIGESAGAMVAAHNIEYAALMDTPKKAPDLQSFEALGLVDFYLVPHYTNPPFQKAAHKTAGSLKLKPSATMKRFGWTERILPLKAWRGRNNKVGRAFMPDTPNKLKKRRASMPGLQTQSQEQT